MQANLVRIPDDDANAVKALGRVGQVVDGPFLRSLDDNFRSALGRYGVRSASLALRRQSTDLLHAGLLSAAIAAAAGADDSRDLMVGYTLHYDAAQRLGLSPRELFEGVAAKIADPTVSGLLRNFGRRGDVTLAAFGWRLVKASDGLDYAPT